MPEYVHPGWLDIELLGDLLADRRQCCRALTARADPFIDLVNDLHPRERLRQRPSDALGAAVYRHGHRAEKIGLFGVRIIASCSRLGFVEHQRD